MTTSANNRVQEGMRQTGESADSEYAGTEGRGLGTRPPLAGMICSHTRDDRFAMIGDPLEAASLLVFIELLKVMRSDEQGLQMGGEQTLRHVMPRKRKDRLKRKDLMR